MEPQPACRFDPRAAFEARVLALPRLGLGISTEFGAGAQGLDVLALRARRPELASFLEIGVDLERGLDETARAWVGAGAPTTYHFLDLNLEQEDDADEAWCGAAAALAREIGAAWLCGDAGLWHVGPRDRGHGVLMPPILVPESAAAIARSVRRVRHATGFEVLPENPPAHLYVGDLHLLDYFARVMDAGDCGMLLDVAHLAIYQRAAGEAPLTGLDAFPLDRVVEVHVAGGSEFTHRGRIFVDDDHGTGVLPDTWQILEHVVPRARNLRAVVFECERNPESRVRAASSESATWSRARRPSRERPRGSAARALPHAGRSALRRAAANARSRERALDGARGARPRAVARARPRGPLGGSRGAPRRAAQLLSNASGEFALCRAATGRGAPAASDWSTFARSPEFHAAVSRGEPFPLAFAAFAKGVVGRAGSPWLAALLRLETSMAEARRLPAARPAPARTACAPGEEAQGRLRLAASAVVLALPLGVFDLAVKMRAALDAGRRPPPLPRTAPRPKVEHVLVYAGPPRPFQMREVRVEALVPEVAALLLAAMEPAGVSPHRFAETRDLEVNEVLPLVLEFVREGVLVPAP